MKRTDAQYLTHEPEEECFDVKSARIKPADLAHVSQRILLGFARD